MLTRSSTNSCCSSTNSGSSTNSTNSGSSSGSHSTSSRAIVPYAPRTRSSKANANANANVAKSNRVLRPRTSSSFLAAAASAGAASDEPPKKKEKTNKNNNNDKLIFPAYQLPDRSLDNLNDKIMDRTKERRDLVKDHLQGESTLTVSVRSGQVILLLSL